MTRKEEIAKELEKVYDPENDGINGKDVLADMYNFYSADELADFLEFVKEERGIE